ncbi:hypothetical protein FRACA_4560001 [Frankia canadensis]|uniref:Uncharacterized protein n=1 Tax=Frankia canadensis TaxID=1836972 RepID=A0A2I2KXM2_9ACTN|nr:hypothetical protein FRACA_4560001 [Frankia canadensis]SOU57699.1 hypothetical protein FRACA_4560001 [Frankia canadensis]
MRHEVARDKWMYRKEGRLIPAI